MAIAEHDLEKINLLIEAGSNISEVANQFPVYDYWEIYWAADDYSLLGKKRMISNRLVKIREEENNTNRNMLIDEIQDLFNDIYQISKKNGNKLIKMSQILSK